jgi:DUF1365 family protein
LDLEELPALLAGGYGLYRSRFSPASFCRGDHLGDPRTPLADAVRNLFEERTGWRPMGPIRLLTLLRNWGYYFSPLNLYYCFDEDGENVESIVAEVSNTPWLERHWYVLWNGNRFGEPSQLRFRHAKGFHVSPFMNMDVRYDWHLQPPGEQLSVAMVNFRGDKHFFDVSMVLNRRALNRGSMLRVLAGYPWMTGRVVQAIYWQALWLWWKKCPYYPHPKSELPVESPQL